MSDYIMSYYIPMIHKNIKERYHEIITNCHLMYSNPVTLVRPLKQTQKLPSIRLAI